MEKETRQLVRLTSNCLTSKVRINQRDGKEQPVSPKVEKGMTHSPCITLTR